MFKKSESDNGGLAYTVFVTRVRFWNFYNTKSFQSPFFRGSVVT